MSGYCPDCLMEVITYAFLSPDTHEWVLRELCWCRNISNPVAWFIKTPPFYPNVRPTDFPQSVRMHPSVADAVVLIERYLEYMREEDGKQKD